ncbi:hypothetical protein ACS0TY_035244 [Phlomoides rotata]
MVISERWSLYREDNVEKARIVKEKLLNDGWWDLVDYILHFTKLIYSMLRSCDTDKSCLHLVYEMWDAMIFEVKKVIFEHEKKSNFEESCFWNVVHKVLEGMWGKSKMWDVAGDSFDYMDDVGILGVVNLSLDEPELESVLFGGEGGLSNDDDHPIGLED